MTMVFVFTEIKIQEGLQRILVFSLRINLKVPHSSVEFLIDDVNFFKRFDFLFPLYWLSSYLYFVVSDIVYIFVENASRFILYFMFTTGCQKKIIFAFPTFQTRNKLPLINRPFSTIYEEKITK